MVRNKTIYYYMLYNIYCRPFFQLAFLQLPSRGSPLTLSNIDRMKMKTAAASVAKHAISCKNARAAHMLFTRKSLSLIIWISIS